jgi:lactoylglutathione lyase
MHIEHLAIWTRDLERLRAFYETYFSAITGSKYTNRQKGFSSYFLSFDDGARIELMQKDSIPETKNDPLAQFTGLIHFAISTGSEQNVDELTTRLRADGFQVLDGPRHTGDGYYESIVLDPDGNRVEITI